MDIKQRLRQAIDSPMSRLATDAQKRELCRDALAEIERIERPLLQCDCTAGRIAPLYACHRERQAWCIYCGEPAGITPAQPVGEDL